jgi:hypothetical protein
MRIDSDWPARSGMGGHIHRLTEDVRTPPRRKPAPRREGLSPKQRGEINDWLLDQLPLEMHHLEHPRGRQRQLSDEQIQHRRYRSWPARDERSRLAALAWTTFGPLMCGYPGYYSGKDGDPAFAGPEGLLLPTLDIDANLVALQVRPDAVVGPKRVWLSSAGRSHGTGSGAPAHVSRPTVSTETTGNLYVVEGVLNADICADRLGAVCIGLAGVTNWRTADWEEVVRRLVVQTVIVALDRDGDGSRADAERVLLREEVAQFAVAKVAVWDPVLAKGFDDCLNMGTLFATT